MAACITLIRPAWPSSRFNETAATLNTITRENTRTRKGWSKASASTGTSASSRPTNSTGVQCTQRGAKVGMVGAVGEEMESSMGREQPLGPPGKKQGHEEIDHHGTEGRVQQHPAEGVGQSDQEGGQEGAADRTDAADDDDHQREDQD